MEFAALDPTSTRECHNLVHLHKYASSLPVNLDIVTEVQVSEFPAHVDKKLYNLWQLMRSRLTSSLALHRMTGSCQLPDDFLKSVPLPSVNLRTENTRCLYLLAKEFMQLAKFGNYCGSYRASMRIYQFIFHLAAVASERDSEHFELLLDMTRKAFVHKLMIMSVNNHFHDLYILYGVTGVGLRVEDCIVPIWNRNTLKAFLHEFESRTLAQLHGRLHIQRSLPIELENLTSLVSVVSAYHDLIPIYRSCCAFFKRARSGSRDFMLVFDDFAAAAESWVSADMKLQVEHQELMSRTLVYTLLGHHLSAFNALRPDDKVQELPVTSLDKRLLEALLHLHACVSWCRADTLVPRLLYNMVYELDLDNSLYSISKHTLSVALDMMRLSQEAPKTGESEAEVLFQLCCVLNFSGMVEKRMGRVAVSECHYRESWSLLHDPRITSRYGQASVTLRTTRCDAAKGLSDVTMHQNKLDETIEWCRAALELDSSPLASQEIVFVNLAVFLHVKSAVTGEEADKSEAEQLLREASTNTSSSYSVIELAMFLASQGRISEAEPVLRRAYLLALEDDDWVKVDHIEGPVLEASLRAELLLHPCLLYRIALLAAYLLIIVQCQQGEETEARNWLKNVAAEAENDRLCDSEYTVPQRVQTAMARVSTGCLHRIMALSQAK